MRGRPPARKGRRIRDSSQVRRPGGRAGASPGRLRAGRIPAANPSRASCPGGFLPHGSGSGPRAGVGPNRCRLPSPLRGIHPRGAGRACLGPHRSAGPYPGGGAAGRVDHPAGEDGRPRGDQDRGPLRTAPRGPRPCVRRDPGGGCGQDGGGPAGRVQGPCRGTALADRPARPGSCGRGHAALRARSVARGAGAPGRGRAHREGDRRVTPEDLPWPGSTSFPCCWGSRGRWPSFPPSQRRGGHVPVAHLLLRPVLLHRALGGAAGGVLRGPPAGVPARSGQRRARALRRARHLLDHPGRSRRPRAASSTEWSAGTSRSRGWPRTAPGPRGGSSWWRSGCSP